MPRRKRSDHAASMASKRWCSDSIEKSNESETETRYNARLLNLSKIEPLTSNPGIEESGQYIIVDTNQLKKLFETVKCSNCLNNSLTLKLGRMHGFATELTVFCEDCLEENSKLLSSKQQDVEKGKIADVNLRITQAFNYIGKGYSAIEQFSMVMNMGVYSSKTYGKCFEKLESSCSLTVQSMFNNVHTEIKKAYEDNAGPTGAINLAVSFDGTWLTRGYKSLIGVGCIIDILTGYVVDFEIMSKVCRSCAVAANELGQNSAEFFIWYEGHKSSCDINHTGSSGAMEIYAAEALWKRSESLGFRYTTMLSDGDSKTFDHLSKLQVYGKDVLLKKEECVNHVSKRLGTGLRKIVQDCKARGVTLGGKKYGSLHDKTIKKMTTYYHSAILKNKGNVQDMKTAIYATLYHNISTDKKPQHAKCPTGEKSWCFYQSAVAQDKKPGLHKEFVKTPLKEELLPYILPVYQRLAGNDLLERCVRCSTQNANESLHSIIWSRCPKETFVTKNRVKCSVSNAVCEFNKGISATIASCQENLGVPVGYKTRQLSSMLDLRKCQFRKRRQTLKFQRARKLIKIAISRREKELKKREGITYGAGCGS